MSKQGSGSYKPVDEFRETRRNLPHHEEPGSTYFLTFRVRHGLMPNAARCVVMAACLYWDARRYELHACVVMPDHVHLLLTPLPTPGGEGYHSLTTILHGIKSYTANQINRLLGRKGSFWLDERYDRVMRDEAEFGEKLRYIENNAVVRELVHYADDYPFLYLEDQT